MFRIIMRQKYKIKKSFYAGEKLYRGYERILWIFYIPFTKYSFVKDEIKNEIDNRVWIKQRKKLA